MLWPSDIPLIQCLQGHGDPPVMERSITRRTVLPSDRCAVNSQYFATISPWIYHEGPSLFDLGRARRRIFWFYDLIFSWYDLSLSPLWNNAVYSTPLKRRFFSICKYWELCGDKVRAIWLQKIITVGIWIANYFCRFWFYCCSCYILEYNMVYKSYGNSAGQSRLIYDSVLGDIMGHADKFASDRLI